MKSYFLTELKYQFKQAWNKWSRLLCQGFIGLAISLCAILIWSSPTGQRLDFWVLQQFFAFRGPLPAPPQVAIVALDDITYQKLDISTRLPFPRSYFAEALEQMVAASPKAIIIDARIPKERQDEAAETRIEAALRAGPTTIWSGEIPKGNYKYIASETDNPFFTQPSDQRFRDAAKMELPMLLPPDVGLVARIALDPREKADLYSRVPLARPLVELAKMEIQAPGPRDLINYYGDPGAITRYSLHQLFGKDAAATKEKLRDKVILYGYQSIGRGRGQMDKDELIVPLRSNQMFGVEIHANIVGNLIERSWIKRTHLMNEIFIIYLLSLVLAIVGVILTPGRTVALVIVITALIIAVAYVSFVQYRFWIPGVGTIILIAGVIILGSALYHYIIIKSFKQYIQRTFKFDTAREI